MRYLCIIETFITQWTVRCGNFTVKDGVLVVYCYRLRSLWLTLELTCAGEY